MTRGRWLRAIGLVFLIGAVMAPALTVRADNAIEAPVEGPTSTLTIKTETGVYPFEVELARTEAERSVGLMYRRQMARTHGMLFDMERTAEAGFWMANTYLPLDLIFIGADGTVKSIAMNAEPLSRAIIPSRVPVRFVLELNAGLVDLIGLEPGDRVSHPLIDALAGP